MPRNHSSRGTQSTHSVACQIRYARQDGRASTASGTSHSEYCGLHTLFVSRNPATVRNSSCGSRGRRGARRASSTTPASANTTASDAMPFTFGVPAGRFCCRAVRYSNPYQSVSKSAERDRLSSKNRRQAAGYSAATGRLTATQASAAPANVQANAPSRLVRRQSASSGIRNSPG